MCLGAYDEWQDISKLLCYCQAAELSLAADAPACSCILLVPALPGPAWPLISIDALLLKCHHACILASCRNYADSQHLGLIWLFRYNFLF